MCREVTKNKALMSCAAKNIIILGWCRGVRRQSQAASLCIYRRFGDTVPQFDGCWEKRLLGGSHPGVWLIVGPTSSGFLWSVDAVMVWGRLQVCLRDCLLFSTSLGHGLRPIGGLSNHGCWAVVPGVPAGDRRAAHQWQVRQVINCGGGGGQVAPKFFWPLAQARRFNQLVSTLV